MLVLYDLLETLQVRQIINRHCPTRGDIDHDTVALVLLLNPLMFPLPLYQGRSPRRLGRQVQR